VVAAEVVAAVAEAVAALPLVVERLQRLD